MSDPQNWSFETRQIHAGTSPDPTTGARALPIYATTSYQFRDTQHAADLFALAEMGNIYTRIMNPTQDALEQRVASLEGGVAALAVSSGQAAETLAILNLAEAGDHVVASASLYGGTYNLLHHSLPEARRHGLLRRGPRRPGELAVAGAGEHQGLLRRDDRQPEGRRPRHQPVAGVAHRNGVPLIVDNTIATPYLIRPVRVRRRHRRPLRDEVPGRARHRHRRRDRRLGQLRLARRQVPGSRRPTRRTTASSTPPSVRRPSRSRPGCSCCATSARRSARSTPSSSCRASRRCRCAWSGTWRTRCGWREFLEGHDAVDRVNYPGLASSPWHAAQQKYAPKGAGAVLTFELHGGMEAGQRFVDALELHSHVANIGDVRSLVIHPASTTHSQLTPEEQLTTGVTPGLVRLAVGLEGIEDILADLEAGFRAAKSA